MLSSLERRI
jgi:hypothetical protein